MREIQSRYSFSCGRNTKNFPLPLRERVRVRGNGGLMNCKDIKEALHAFCDGEASALEKKIIEEHLNACLSCQEEVIRIKDSISLLKTQDIQKAPEGFAKETMLLIKERQEYREEREEEGIPVDFVLSSMFYFARGLWRGVGF